MKSSVASRNSGKPVILITGCSGLIGARVVRRLHRDYQLVGIDRDPVSDELDACLDWIECDLTEDASVAEAISKCRDRYGEHWASVIHLAAYYDFSGEPSPLYRELTVEGTSRLLTNLQPLEVEQFIFSSTLLVMESASDGQLIDESSAVDAEWDYPQSKLAAEEVIRQKRGSTPAVSLRIAGVYDEDCHSLPLSQHIRRIYEKRLESYLFPGDKDHGQSFVHLDDLASCFGQTVARRSQLDNFEVFLIGEEDVMSYDELQETIGMQLHGKEWPTIRIPKPVAKAGAWAQGKIAQDEEDEPFIKPWMVDLADQNYPIRARKAQQRLGWEPEHTLRETLPEILTRLKHDPVAWYEANKLTLPDDLPQEGVVRQ